LSHRDQDGQEAYGWEFSDSGSLAENHGCFVEGVTPRRSNPIFNEVKTIVNVHIMEVKNSFSVFSCL